MTLSEQIQGQRRSSKKSKNKTQAATNTTPAAGNTNPRTKPETQQKKGRKSSAGSAMAAAATAAKDPKRDRRSTLPATRDAAAESKAAAEAAPASSSGRDRGLRGSFRALRKSTEDLSNAASAIKKTIGSFVRSSPLRRSFSFGRDLNKVGGLRKTAWSASLQSLQEDVPEEEAVAGAAKFLAEDKRDSFIEDEEDAELAKDQGPAPKPTDSIVGVPTRELEFKARSLVIEDSGAYSKDPEFQALMEASRRRTQSYSAVQRLGLEESSDEPDTAMGRRGQRPHSASAQHLPGEVGDPLELERLLPARGSATLPARKPVRQNSDSVFSRGFWHELFSSKGRSLSLSHIEQAGVEPQEPSASALSTSAAARGVTPGMCVSAGPGFPILGSGFPPAAMSAPAASPAATCLDVPGADGGGGGGGGGGGEPPPPAQGHAQPPDRSSGPGVTTVTSFVGSSRRHRLVRSQVNSSEYFSVSFELAGGGDAGPDEFVAACRGVTLAEALQASCGRRGVDVSALVASVDDARTPLTADTASLAGRHVRLTVRDAQSPTRSSSKDSNTSSAPLLKSVSEQSYDRGWSSGRSVFSVSTDDGGELEAAPSRADRGASARSQGAASKQRWSSLFGNSKDTKMEALVEQLKQYSESGIPRHVRAEPDDYEAHREELEQMGKADWREWLCGSGAELTERRRQQQAALWELLATEAAYVQVIHVVTRLFLACLRSLQGSGLLVEVDAARLFCNVEAVAAASLQFWVRHLAPAVASARLRALPLDPLHLRDGFLRFHETFQPYTRYCAEQLNCQAYCREMCRKDELFAAYLAWCEAQPACGRLRLADLLVKPMQRLTRYSLLLRAVLRHTDDEHHATALARMITCVDEFVNNVNSSLKTKQDNEKLKALIARIESYDVVEAVKDEELERLVRLHSQLDLTGPMPGCHVSQPRQLLLESDLKLREGAASKTDVRCVLVTDALLVCKPVGRRRGAASRAGAALRVVRPPYLVERLRVSELASGLGVAVVYLSEWRSAVHAFTLSSNDPRTVRVWVEAVQRAQDLYATARMAWSPAPQLSSPLGAAPPLALSHVGAAQHQQTGAAEPQPEWPAPVAAGAAEAMVHSPRLESSRSSRLSSLAHSHSSSLEMNEASSLSSASQSQSREASVDINRGSSVSSDEGLLVPHSATAAGDSRQTTSPRTDRRSRLLSPTPSSLSLLQPPSFQSGLGQSLPNLTLGASRAADALAALASRSVTPTPRSSPAAAGPAPAPAAPSGSPVLGHSPPASLLLVPGQGHGAIRKQRHAQPQHLLSPGHRGVSYPPPSPCRGSLQRTTPVPQSRNPPLVKTGHVASVGSLGLQQRLPDLGVPLIAGVSPPSDEKPSPGDDTGEGGRGPPQQPLQSPGAGPVDACVTSAADGNGKRLGRTDNRRYKTAGAIDDIKKQESRDCSIHKRLSWNCGRQQQQPGTAGAAVAAGAGSGGGSQESVRSSSGVSSGGSASCLLPQGAEPVQEVVYEWRRAPSCPPPQGQRQLLLGAGGYYPQGGTPPLSPRAVPLEAVNIEMVQPMRTPEASQGASGTPTPRAATPSPTPLEHQPHHHHHHHHHRHQHHQRRPPGGLQRMKDAIVMDSPVDGSNV